jgi:chemotaxis methyl-accepting protein methylase
VRDRVGVDFSQYRPATTARRIRNRMLTVGITSVDEYAAFLTAHPGEADALAERLAIKVSRFYRNAVTFDLLRDQVVPMLADTAGSGPVRVWCAGCGCGEEAYTLAMLLDDAGIAGGIDATDIDRAALASAERGVYGAAALGDLPPELAQRYLDPIALEGAVRYRVQDTLRERVRFIWHDVTAGGLPGSETVALVSCRNVLIYLQLPAQKRALRHLCAALGPAAMLVLGEAEWPAADQHRDPRLEVIAARARVFRAERGRPGERR